jgi:hypothetical protein
VTADRFMAGGLGDIILYHMVNSEFHAAGSGLGMRVPEARSEKESLARLEAVSHYRGRIPQESGGF